MPWELRVEMAAESPSKTEMPADDEFDDMEQVEMEQPKLSLSIIAEDTLEVKGLVPKATGVVKIEILRVSHFPLVLGRPWVYKAILHRIEIFLGTPS